MHTHTQLRNTHAMHKVLLHRIRFNVYAGVCRICIIRIRSNIRLMCNRRHLPIRLRGSVACGGIKHRKGNFPSCQYNVYHPHHPTPLLSCFILEVISLVPEITDTFHFQFADLPWALFPQMSVWFLWPLHKRPRSRSCGFRARHHLG